MSKVTHPGRRLRALWGTLAVLCLVGAGASYGMSRISQSEAEFAATVEARDLAQDVLEPQLTPIDGTAPIEGARYQELLSSVRQRVLAAPSDQVRVWRQDGTILFANDRALVGDRYPAPSGIDLGGAPAGASRSVVDAGRFRTFTWMGIRNAPDVVAVEIARPYGPIVAESERLWQPWVARALSVGVIFGLLAVATGIFGALAARRRTSQRVMEEATAPAPRSRWTPDMPEYMRPGYRQEVEERRRLEEEQLVAALKASAARSARAAGSAPAARPAPDAVTLAEVTLPDAPEIPEAPPDHEDLAARLRRIARERERDENAVGTSA